MIENQLKYFQIARELNEKYNKTLLQQELHFRGSLNSFSLISISQESPEIGIKNGLKSQNNVENILNKKIILKNPGRKTEEKNLQAFIISYAMNHHKKLPFGDFTFITSEFAFPIDSHKRIVNDILALDSKNNLAIIELKSLRNNKVKQQTIDFEEKVVKPQTEFFKELVYLMTGKEWSGKIRKIAVWKAPEKGSRIQKNNYKNIDLFNYTFEGINTKNKIIMNKVTFSKE